MRQRLYRRVEYFGLRLDFSISDFRAIVCCPLLYFSNGIPSFASRLLAS
jgi:hypothetical protein